MKRIFAFILMTMALGVSAQQFVLTTPQTRNVIIEEFTGIYCPNCPDGHVVANQIVDAIPGRAWAVNIHAGGYAPISYPNFNTTDGTAIFNGFNITGYPQAVVNRSTANGLSRTDWPSHANQQISQTAECNVAGQVVINAETRVATVTVEVYYTSNSSMNTNYLNVIMLQDDIIGPQQGGSANPDQYVNGQYRHMHIFRDAITPTWGEAISPTTNGTLITKTYEYVIPEVIGSPNGVSVELEDVLFLAFVTEKYQDTPTRPVLNVNELGTFIGTNQEIYPYISSIVPSDAFCTNEKVLNVNVTNGGLQNLTSLDFEIAVDNGTSQSYSWDGNIASYDNESVQIPVEIPAGNHNVTVKIVKANGTSYNESESLSITVEEWATAVTSADEEELTIEIMQDKYGNQTTWQLLKSDYTVLASGGPYQFLSGSSATQLNEAKAVVPAGECVQFVIKDDGGNGICCQFGDGYYRIKDSQDNVIIDGDGAFGDEAKHLVSVVKNENGIQNITAQICEGESYTEYGFDIVDAEVGTHEYENVYNGITYVLTLTVVENPVVNIAGETQISQGETTILIASGADSYLWSTGETNAMIVVTPEETTTYSVVGTKNGCEDEAEVTVNVTVGVEENTMNEVKVYPNPTKGELNIECKGMQEIIVFMPNGQTMEKFVVSGDSYVLNMNEYKSGVYYVKVISESGINLIKSIKL